MKYSCCLLSSMVGIWGSVASAETEAGSEPLGRIVVVKADDLREPNAKWKRFVQIAEEQDIKVSIGIIAYGFPLYDSTAVEWTRGLEESGRVEFWNHGWDHNHWKDPDGRRVSEFFRSGYEHQKENLEKSQKKLVSILGHPAEVFGSPFNAMDQDTLTVLEEMPEFRGVFYYHLKEPLKSSSLDKCMLYMYLPGENDGTGKPNFEKFKAKYASREKELTFTALQFHPPYFSEEGFAEFEKIVEFLKEEGWTFMLPREYIDWTESQATSNP
ncbi:DUF2334 domain-containing protein [Puniceicoccus vermicola]|uniref:Polysaccharide deacetylase family protein n=1 Tax=Puniceicoccus vermicola TaxID=388746 RepID=A0A7X1B0L8_9BACT|nr:DUF2334 domain-containing protein [Puniceicoccus vermicola]MBC2603430.1 polysaccharide deacetylase family protein [Puniceicoccus vermicola]